MKSYLSSILTIGIIVSLGGCAGQSATQQAVSAGASCPQTGFLKHTETIETAEIKATMEDLDGGCHFKDGQVVLTTRFNISAKWIGRAEAPKGLEIPYFATIVDPNENVLAVQDLTAQVELDHTIGQSLEELTQSIPLNDVKMSRHYKVIYGFPVE